MKRYSYLAPSRTKIGVNPIGRVNGRLADGAGGYAYSVCSYNFDLSRGDMRDGKGFRPYGNPITLANPSENDRIYFYKRKDGNGGADDRLLYYYAADGCVYERAAGALTANKVDGLNFDDPPSGVCYNYNGEDVMIFSSKSGGMKIYDGTAVTGVEDAPPVTSMCAHGERLFLTDADGDAVWFSDDFDPANWNVSLSEAGFIDFGGAGGRVLKAVSFGGYVYVFKSYGISKVYAYGEQNSFSASEIFVSSGKIRGDSITVCGNCILFFASDGLYRFDGLSATRISDAYEDFLDLSYERVKGAYYDGKAYFSLADDYGGTSTRCILSVDPHNYADYYFIKGVKPTDTAVIAGEDRYALVVLADTGQILELTDADDASDLTAEKIWIGKFGDFGLTARRKLLEEVSFYSDTAASAEVNADGVIRAYRTEASKKRRVIRPNVRADRFSIKIKCTEKNSRVVGLTLKFSYYDE